MDKDLLGIIIGLVIVVSWCFYDTINKWNRRQ